MTTTIQVDRMYQGGYIPGVPIVINRDKDTVRSAAKRIYGIETAPHTTSSGRGGASGVYHLNDCRITIRIDQ